MRESRAHTWFAPGERATGADLDREIRQVTNNPVTDTLLNSVDGLMAILNAHRQVLAVNKVFLEAIGADDAGELMGLRPGEVLDCVHAHEEQGGCGTSRACGTCGAVRAIIEAQQNDVSNVRSATITIRSGRESRDLVVDVKACRFTMDSNDFILLFIHDVTRAHRLAVLERTFLHDVNNIMQGLQSTSELMATEPDSDEVRGLGRHLGELVQHLSREMELQRLLVTEDLKAFRIASDHVPLARVQSELRKVFRFHGATKERHLDVDDTDSHTWIRTDAWVLLRVLSNLVANALEATPAGGRVEVRTMANHDSAVFHVWNAGAIDPQIRHRIFERNFSTKEGTGRGLGTYSAKHLGETLLGAEVAFTSSEHAGTEFRVVLPR
ncbi:MAG: HAMP domain-containing histidine kinase [bacterium]|nr:HAMP domain-containing histidine kinase [bacterium]